MGNKAEETGETIQREESMERCVLCGCVTDMERDWPISMRKYYIEGAGQLCRRCYVDVYEQ